MRNSPEYAGLLANAFGGRGKEVIPPDVRSLASSLSLAAAIFIRSSPRASWRTNPPPSVFPLVYVLYYIYIAALGYGQSERLPPRPSTDTLWKLISIFNELHMREMHFER